MPHIVYWMLPKMTIHGSYYSAEFIFPDFPGRNEYYCFSWLMCSCEISMLAFNCTRNKGGGTNFKVEAQIICEQNEQKNFFWTVVCSLHKTFQTFFCIPVNFCTLVLWFSLTFLDHLIFTWLWNEKFPNFSNFSLTYSKNSLTFPNSRNHALKCTFLSVFLQSTY